MLLSNRWLRCWAYIRYASLALSLTLSLWFSVLFFRRRFSKRTNLLIKFFVCFVLRAMFRHTFSCHLYVGSLLCWVENCGGFKHVLMFGGNFWHYWQGQTGSLMVIIRWKGFVFFGGDCLLVERVWTFWFNLNFIFHFCQPCARTRKRNTQ